MTQSSQFPEQPVASADLRNVMGYYLTGITIVTINGTDKKPYGLTVTSLSIPCHFHRHLFYGL